MVLTYKLDVVGTQTASRIEAICVGKRAVDRTWAVEPREAGAISLSFVVSGFTNETPKFNDNHGNVPTFTVVATAN
ncbi:MAG: hypothetical protein NT069_20225 [Planctomycetota bacterium]|nr:hypothetical protein [Planctomycetota bacterium]